MNLANRFTSKVVSKVIAFAYNSDQAEIFQLLWDVFEIIVS